MTPLVPQTPPAPDHYVIQFLLIGVPMLIFMVVFGVVALRRRWKPIAYILGAVFLLTAGSLLRDARRRSQTRDVLIVQSTGLGCGVAGLLLIVLAARMKMRPRGPGDPGPGPLGG